MIFAGIEYYIEQVKSKRTDFAKAYQAFVKRKKKKLRDEKTYFSRVYTFLSQSSKR